MESISSVKSLKDDLFALLRNTFFESQYNRMRKIVLNNCHFVKNPSNSIKI